MKTILFLGVLLAGLAGCSSQSTMANTDVCQQDAYKLGQLHRAYDGQCDAAFTEKYKDGLMWDDGASLD